MALAAGVSHYFGSRQFWQGILSLNYTTLHYTTLHYTTLHYTTLNYTKLHYTTPHYTKGVADHKHVTDRVKSHRTPTLPPDMATHNKNQ